MKTNNDLSAHSAKGLGAVVAHAVVAHAIPADAPTRSLSQRGNQRNVTLGSVTYYAMMLLMMLLTTATAWAFKTETPTLYTISRNSHTFSISPGSKWDTTNAIWAKDDGHALDNGITIAPDLDVSYQNSFLQINKATTFTFTVPNNLKIAITSVVFKDASGNEVSATSHSEPGTTYTVTLASGTSVDRFVLTYGYIGGSCGTSATWTLSKQDGQYTALTISGSGAMNSYEYETVDELWRTKAPWDWRDLKSVTIGNDITSIGQYAFIGCKQLSSLTIGTSVTTIGINAFDHCDKLTQVTLPASVTTLNDAAFKNCTGLKRLNIQRTDGLVTLSSNVLSGCDKLQYIVAPTPTLALQYKDASNWSAYEGKMSAEFGGYVFYATNEGGTDAYAITSETDLRNLASAINDKSEGIANSKTFRQTKTITLSNTNFDPIGYNDYHYFSGTYDGGSDYTISGLNVGAQSNRSYYGLFGYVKNGTVKNVRLVSPSVSTNGSGTNLGSLIGKTNNATVRNCVVFDPHYGTSGSYNGAIIGSNSSSSLENLYFYGGSYGSIGQGGSGTNVTNVGPARKVTLGSGISSVTPAIDPTATSLDNGFVYDNKTYYREGLELTLASNLSATGKHVVYKAGNNTLTGNTYTVNSTDGDVTLTAELVFNTYTVQFNKNHTDATGSMNNQAFTYGTAQNLTANAFSRTGYTSARWNTQANGSGTSYDNGQSVNNLTTTNNGTVTLYAQWTANQYTVTLDKQGGNGGSASATATYDAAMPAITVPTRTGYTFGGYFTQTNGGGTQYYNADGTSAHIWDKTAATTLYAKWTANTYTVTLNKQDGNGGSASATATYDAAMPAITVPTRTGYTFGGYFTQTNGGGTQYYNADGTSTRTWNLTAATTLYAKWAIITYNITYDLDGGSVSTANPTSYNIETPTFTLNNPSKENYHFVGWTKGNNNTLLPTVTIEQGSTGNLDYTAHYKTNNFTVGEFSYQRTSGTEVKVTACNPSATSVTIPATVTNEDVTYTVTAIEATAFSGCTSLLCLILNSETPPTLGSNAFSACTALNAIGVPAGTAAAYKATAGWLDYEDKIYAINGKCGTNVYYSYNSTTTTLSIFGTGAMADNAPWANYRTDITTVIIGHGVTSIGSMAFNGCTGLTSIEIPASVMTIGHDAFNSCTSLKSIEIPASVTRIGDFAFEDCTSLESVEIPASVTYIGGAAFAECTSLKSIEIPASVTSIGDAAFLGCTSLASISVAEGNPTYDSRKECNAIIETKTNTLLYGCKNTVIPDGVTSIGVRAFADCTSLESITIPASVTSIGDGAFADCTSLESIVIPASVTSIGDNVFEGCTSLESIVIPASVTSIGVAAFADCTSLASISVAEGNPTYDSRKECNAIIETKTNTLLYGCKNTVIPDGVTSIGVAAFAHCTSLKSITIPASVTSIGDIVFEGCTSLKSIVIPASVTSIGDIVFEGCTSLKSIVIPASVTSIGYDAFAGCTSLESVEIPASVTTIGEFAFLNCTSLSSVTIYAPELSEYGWRAFENNASGRKIYVFNKSLATYKAQASRMSVDADDIEAITGINLRDNDDNRSLIAAADGNALGALDVTLKGRTLYKDGDWNTLCLPFNVTVGSGVMTGATAMTLNGSESGFDASTGVLTLNFVNVASSNTIAAGTPFIVKWQKPDGYVAYNPATPEAECSDIVSPVFEGVTVSNAATTQTFGNGSFKGTYQSITFTDKNPSILFLGAGNTLYYPESGAKIGAQRAYFDLGTAQARQFVLRFVEDPLTEGGNFDGEGTQNGIGHTEITEITERAGAWYTLDGVRLDGKPTKRSAEGRLLPTGRKKGLYIHNGRKVVVP